MRKAVASPARAKGSLITIPAPVRGWIADEALVNAKPAGARLLENWIPTETGIRCRGGKERYATISAGPVTSLFTYRSGGVEKFFGADNANIFDISSISDPNTIPAAEVTGRTSGQYSTAHMSNAGNLTYLYAVNGSDSALLYDGSDFSEITGVSTPIAITGVATNELSFVWTFANRLFFVRKGTMSVFYLGVGEIGGAASEINLAGVFSKGGHVIFGGKWSLDSGDGLDDKCVFVSSEGEAAIFQGTDPSDSTNWQKVGVYEITKPLGMNATASAGGDFLIAVEDGIVPISQAVNKDVAALSLAAISKAITPEWKKEVALRSSVPWDMLKWPTNGLLVVAMPVPDDGIDPVCVVANLSTGKWSKITNWDMRCLALFGDDGYFGSRDGRVYRMDAGGSDDGTPYTCNYVAMPDHLRAPGYFKTVHAARAVFKASTPFVPKLSVSVDYQINLPSPPNAAPGLDTGVWDVSLWDQATWEGQGQQTVTTVFEAIGESGSVVSMQVQATFGSVTKPDVELISSDMLFEVGGFMV